MDYEWDEAKREANRIKHGVDFATAADFDWNRAIHTTDARRHYGEVRTQSVAPIAQRLFVMVWTMRAVKIRIISLRKANRREVTSYEHTT